MQSDTLPRVSLQSKPLRNLSSKQRRLDAGIGWGGNEAAQNKQHSSPAAMISAIPSGNVSGILGRKSSTK